MSIAFLSSAAFTGISTDNDGIVCAQFVGTSYINIVLGAP